MPTQLSLAPFELQLAASLVFACWMSSFTHRRCILLMYGRVRWGFFWKPYIELAIGVIILTYGSYYANAPFFFGCSMATLSLCTILRQLKLVGKSHE